MKSKFSNTVYSGIDLGQKQYMILVNGNLCYQVGKIKFFNNIQLVLIKFNECSMTGKAARNNV
jgi:hypothetical protein